MFLCCWVNWSSGSCVEDNTTHKDTRTDCTRDENVKIQASFSPFGPKQHQRIRVTFGHLRNQLQMCRSGHTLPDCACRTTQSPTNTHAHLKPNTQTTQTNHPTTHRPQPTPNVIDRISLGEKRMPCVVISFTTSLCQDCAKCTPAAFLRGGRRFSGEIARLIATSDQQFIMSHHEHNRRKKRSECLCGAWCGVVLYVTWCVCLLA